MTQSLQWGNKTLYLKSHLSLCLEIPYLSSMNQAYTAKMVYSRKKGKWVPRITKNKEAPVMQQVMIIQIRKMGLGDCCKDTYAYICEMGFLAPENYWLTLDRETLRKKDLTNFWKITEDAIATGLGMDDSKCIRQTQYKDFLEKTDNVMKIVYSAKMYGLEENTDD